MGYDTNVFINCPFDEKYTEILRSITFCVLDLGLEPRIALETHDSGTTRIEKIVDLIRESRFGIHDISRLRSTRKNEYARLNMPFELGLDVGSRTFAFDHADGKYSDKKCLILEAENYRYQAALSDIAGYDIAVHKNDAAIATRRVRDWLVDVANISNPPPPSAIWARFTDFIADDFRRLSLNGWSKEDIDGLPFRELMIHMRDWLASHPRA